MNLDDKTIREFKESDLSYIECLFPSDWNFNFKSFIETFLNKPFFKGYSLLMNKVPIGFGNIIVFKDKAWLGNIVISRRYRNMGLGTYLTKFLINEGKSFGVNIFSLFATKLGEPIYSKLGFKTCENYIFYKPDSAKQVYTICNTIRKSENRDLAEISKLNKLVDSEERTEFLKFYLNSTYVVLNSKKQIKGFYIKGLGSGLILAMDNEYGIDLLKMKLNETQGMVVVPESNIICNQFLTENNFEKHFIAPRMVFGKNYKWFPSMIFSRATGYCG